ncbi:MAG: hypothetical protein KDC66_20670 [Phaeodactylibacter sp.]|nr:hypothetical protein [Phaeodactylibacter sp.]MCB9272510.1 hypothetical protein [Lewinellaceae bacterium]
MTKEQLYDRIEAYLEQQMAPEELAAFEADLQVSQELQLELALHRKLHQELAKAGKARLREQLRKASAEFPVERPGRRWNTGRWLTGLAVAIIIMGAAGRAWWLSRQNGPQESPAVTPPAQQDSLYRQTEEPADTISNITPPTEEKASPEPEQKKVADAFASNPRLEALLGAAPDTLYAISADAGFTRRPDGRYELSIAGLLRAVEAPADARFVLRVYDNTAGNAVEEGPLKLVKIEEDEDIYAFGKLQRFSFSYTLKKRLSPGTYYYLAFKEGKAAPLFAGKAVLGKPGGG